MPEYKDMLIQAINNVMAFDWLEITSGLIFHKRTALDRNLMKAAGLDDEFRSFGPMLTVKLSPWYDGPTLTANYERGMNSTSERALASTHTAVPTILQTILTSVTTTCLQDGKMTGAASSSC